MCENFIIIAKIFTIELYNTQKVLTIYFFLLNFFLLKYFNVCVYFFSLDCSVLFEQRVSKFYASGNKWRICCENNSEYEFDAVIFTMPVPQILQLDGILPYVQGIVNSLRNTFLSQIFVFLLIVWSLLTFIRMYCHLHLCHFS